MGVNSYEERLLYEGMFYEKMTDEEFFDYYSKHKDDIEHPVLNRLLINAIYDHKDDNKNKRVKFLIKQGASPYTYPPYETNLLIWSILDAKNYNVVPVLIKYYNNEEKNIPDKLKPFVNNLEVYKYIVYNINFTKNAKFIFQVSKILNGKIKKNIFEDIVRIKNELLKWNNENFDFLKNIKNQKIVKLTLDYYIKKLNINGYNLMRKLIKINKVIDYGYNNLKCGYKVELVKKYPKVVKKDFNKILKSSVTNVECFNKIANILENKYKRNVKKTEAAKVNKIINYYCYRNKDLKDRKKVPLRLLKNQNVKEMTDLLENIKDKKMRKLIFDKCLDIFPSGYGNRWYEFDLNIASYKNRIIAINNILKNGIDLYGNDKDILLKLKKIKDDEGFIEYAKKYKFPVSKRCYNEFSNLLYKYENMDPINYYLITNRLSYLKNYAKGVKYWFGSSSIYRKTFQYALKHYHNLELIQFSMKKFYEPSFSDFKVAIEYYPQAVSYIFDKLSNKNKEKAFEYVMKQGNYQVFCELIPKLNISYELLKHIADNGDKTFINYMAKHYKSKIKQILKNRIELAKYQIKDPSRYEIGVRKIDTIKRLTNVYNMNFYKDIAMLKKLSKKYYSKYKAYKREIAKREYEENNLVKRVIISDCYRHMCSVRVNHYFAGNLDYKWKDKAYVIHFVKEGGHWIGTTGYYADSFNELNSRCGKKTVYSLDEAMKAIVKCSIMGHY